MNRLIFILFFIGVQCSIFAQEFGRNSKTKVSPDILHSFYMMESAMQNVQKNLDDANTLIINAIDREAEKKEVTVIAIKDKAHQAKVVTDLFISFIDSTKMQLLMLDKKNLNKHRNEFGELINAADMQIGNQYFMGTNNSQGAAIQFIARINEVGTKLIALTSDTTNNSYWHINRGYSEEEQLSWIKQTFNVPMASVFAILTEFQMNTKRSESDILNYLFLQIKNLELETSKVIIEPSSNEVSSGSEYRANIYLASINTNGKNQVYVNGIPLLMKDGVGIYSTRAYGEGEKKYNVTLENTNPATNKLQTYSAFGQYYVSSPIATISAFKMSIMYADFDNPFEVSVPGYRQSQLTVNCENGEITDNKGYYTCRVKLGEHRTLKINVIAKGADSVSRTFSKEFKIRPLPDLTVSINGKNGGIISKEEAAVWKFVNSSFGPSFAYDGLQYIISEFRCCIYSANGTKEFKINGSNISDELRNGLSACNSGDRIVFYDIKASSYGGLSKNFYSGPVFTIK